MKSNTKIMTMAIALAQFQIEFLLEKNTIQLLRLKSREEEKQTNVLVDAKESQLIIYMNLKR